MGYVCITDVTVSPAEKQQCHIIQFKMIRSYWEVDVKSGMVLLSGVSR